MMGQHEPQLSLFAYRVDLDRRVPADHPLRPVLELIDFSFVRTSVATKYGYNGNESVDPEIILKLMFLLFFDNVPSERELMRTLPYRLDYLWFLKLGLDDAVPDHSVLSKARKRWGAELFEELFVRVVSQCVEAGLVEGSKIHMDGSLVDANASKNSVRTSSPALIAALRKAYQAEERKLEPADNLGSPNYEAVNDRAMSETDPDAALVRKHSDSRPRFKHHRVVDNAFGVITAVKTTALADASRACLQRYAQHCGEGDASTTSPDLYRASSGVTSRIGFPMYSEEGRMMRLLARCSMMCAHQPVTRDITNSGVNIGVGMPHWL